MGIPFQITVDCDDADVMSRFWAIALDYIVEPPPPGHSSWEAFLRANDFSVPEPGSISAIVDPDEVGPRILFLRVPEAKTVKNRLHLDIRAGATDDERTEKAAQLVAEGATEVGRVDEDGKWWMVLTDPEGNEFCVT